MRGRQTGTQQELQQLYQELGTLKQQAGQAKDKLQRWGWEHGLQTQGCPAEVPSLHTHILLLGTRPSSSCYIPCRVSSYSVRQRQRYHRSCIFLRISPSRWPSPRNRTLRTPWEERWVCPPTWVRDGIVGQGDREEKLKDRPYSLPIAYLVFPRLTTHSLLEMQAYHGFLADSNIQKNPRAGQTPTQAVVSPDSIMAGGRVSGQSISVSELYYSWKGWDVGRNKEFILWLKFSTLSPCPAYSRLVWLFLFPSSLTLPSLQDGLKFFECSLIFDYIAGQGRLWILFIKNPGALSAACLSAYLHMLVGRATLKGQQHDRCLDRCEWREYRSGRDPGVGHQRFCLPKRICH